MGENNNRILAGWGEGGTQYAVCTPAGRDQTPTVDNTTVLLGANGLLTLVHALQVKPLPTHGLRITLKQGILTTACPLDDRVAAEFGFFNAGRPDGLERLSAYQIGCFRIKRNGDAWQIVEPETGGLLTGAPPAELNRTAAPMVSLGAAGR